MNLVFNGLLCLTLSLGSIFALNKLSITHKCVWVRAGKNYVGSVFFSIFLFFTISIFLLSILLYFIFYDYANNLLLLFKSSGLMLAIVIAITGLCARGMYSIILKYINKKARDELYPLEYSDAKWLFVFSCLVVVILCFSVDIYMQGCTVIAIIIGKFVWFDIAPNQKDEERNSLFKVPLLYFAVLFYLLLIVVYTYFFEYLISGCLVGIVTSWLACLVYYFYQHTTRKGGHFTMEDRKAWTSKTLFAKINSYIKPELKVRLSEKEEVQISNIHLFTAEYKHLFNLCADDNVIRTIANVLENLSSESFNIKIHLFELLCGNEGYLYELLTYDWLIKKGVGFAPQQKVSSEDVLSNKSCGTILDGVFLNYGIYFDIKSFEIPANIKGRIIDKLSTRFPNFNIMFEGNLDSDYLKLASLTLKKMMNIEKAVEKAFASKKHLNYDGLFTWSYKIPELGISINFEEKGVNGSIHFAIGEFDSYEWAMNNEVFFLKNVEQYTTKRPFVLICPYKDLTLFGNDENIKIGLRSIARRAFIKLYNITESNPDYDRYNKEAHRKIDNSVPIANITSYLSGILFIDIAKMPVVKDGFFFANPNAIKKLEFFHLKQIFNYEIQDMPYYDNFVNDNY